MLVVRELMLGAKRFGDIKDGLPGISANVLSHRLDELERAGLVTRRKLPKPAAVWVYDLTDWARDLEPVMQMFGRWAARDPRPPQGPALRRHVADSVAAHQLRRLARRRRATHDPARRERRGLRRAASRARS